MRPKYFDFDPANASLTGFLSNATGAGPFTMTTTHSGDNLAHQVSIRNDSATDHSAKTFTLTGTDADGRAITETLNAPGANATVESTKYFLTLTSATVSATIGSDTMDFGWVDEFASQTIPLDHYSSVAALIQAEVTGTINFDIEITLDDIFATLDVAGNTVDEQADFLWLNDANVAGETASQITVLGAVGIRAIRFVANSYTDTAEVQLAITQPFAR